MARIDPILHSPSLDVELASILAGGSNCVSRNGCTYYLMGYQLMSLIRLNKVYMQELIHARRSASNMDGMDDLLSRLISATEEDKDSPYHFTDEKLTGGCTFAS
jgi:hypothetical protein